MTAYNLKPPATLPSLARQQAKEKRKKPLAQVRARRREIYKKLGRKKRPLQPDSDLL